MSTGPFNVVIGPARWSPYRINAVAIALWGVRIAVIAVIVAGSIGTIRHDPYSAAQWASFVLSGLTLGSLYAQIALGYTMVYGVLRLINFAHGDITMCGAFGGYFVASALAGSGFLEASPIVAMAVILVAGMIVSGVIAVLTERIAYRPFRQVRGFGFAPLITAFGVSFFLEQSVRGLFGSGVKAYPSPKWQSAQFHWLGFSVPFLDLMVIVLALVFMAVLYAIVQGTRMGTAMRAVSEDAEAASLMGVDVGKVIIFTFALGGAMAGIAGVFYAFLFKQVYFFMGFTPGIKAFAAAVLGGIGSIPGAVFGGFFIGLVESIGPPLFLEGLGIPSSYQLHDAVAYTLMILVLVFRPQGILGEHMAKKRA